MNPKKIPEPGKSKEKSAGDLLATPAVWDAAYAMQGRLWGGVPVCVPAMPDHSRVLELGCGSGKILEFLTGRPYECIGLDFSENACRLAQQTVKNPHVNLLVADARRVPLRSGSIDAVIAYHVAGHLLVEDRIVLVMEATRVLARGGRFLFCDFSEEDFRAAKGLEIEERTYRRGTGITTHYFTEEEVRSLFKAFRVETLATIHRPMRIRGRDYPRAEIVATFVKP